MINYDRDITLPFKGAESNVPRSIIAISVFIIRSLPFFITSFFFLFFFMLTCSKLGPRNEINGVTRQARNIKYDKEKSL